MTDAQLWLARVQPGHNPAVFKLDRSRVQLAISHGVSGTNKHRAKLFDREPAAWQFTVRTVHQGHTISRLCAAAIDHTPAAAIAAAMRVLAQHEAAKVSR